MKIKMPRNVAVEIITSSLRPRSLPICCTNNYAEAQPGQVNELPPLEYMPRNGKTIPPSKREPVTLAHVNAKLDYFWLYEHVMEMEKYQPLYDLGIELGLGVKDVSSDICCDPKDTPVFLVSKNPITYPFSEIEPVDQVSYRFARMWAHADSSLHDWSMEYMKALAHTLLLEETDDYKVEWTVLGDSPQAKFARAVQDAGVNLPFAIEDLDLPPTPWKKRTNKATLEWVQFGWDEDDSGWSLADKLFPDIQFEVKQREYVEGLLAESIEEIRRLWDAGKICLAINKDASKVMRDFDAWRNVEQLTFKGMEGQPMDPYLVASEY